MLCERTSVVGLDVHAHHVVAAAIDGVTGEVIKAKVDSGSHGDPAAVGAPGGPVRDVDLHPPACP